MATEVQPETDTELLVAPPTRAVTFVDNPTTPPTLNARPSGSVTLLVDRTCSFPSSEISF